MMKRESDVQQKLLSTKFHTPPVSPHVIPRKRLIPEKQIFREKKVTLVTAPAGYGKTTLVSQWVNQFDIDSGWISLDQEDNDPVMFWGNVLEALQLSDSGMKNMMMDRGQIAVFVKGLLNHMSRLSDRILVFDDYHEIQNELLHESFTYFLEHLPGTVHVIVISRVNPHGFLHRLRVQYKLFEVTKEKLQFNRSETAVLFRNITGSSLSEGDVDTLYSYMEGWIAGLHLAAVAMKEEEHLSDFIKNLQKGKRHINEYLIEEVIKRQPVPFRKFLFHTSILKRMNGSLCSAVTGMNDAHHILQMLESNNAFIQPADHHKKWYRYHHFFGEMLREMLIEQDRNLVALLHRRAGEWYARETYYYDAIDHFIAGNDFENAMKWIVHVAPVVLKKGEITTLFQWLKSFSDDWMVCHPDLAIIHAWALALSDEFERAKCVLLQTEQYLHEQTDQSDDSKKELMAEIHVVRGYIAIIQNDVPLSKKHFSEATRFSPGISRYFRAGMDFNQGEPLLLKSSLGLGGRLKKVHDLYTSLRLLWKNSGLPIIGYGSVLLGEMHYEWNHMDEVSYFVRRGMQFGTQVKQIGILFPAYFLSIRRKWALGDTAGAWLVVDELHGVLKDYQDPAPWVSLFEAIRARLWIKECRKSEVENWIAKSFGDQNTIQSDHDFVQITYIRALYLLGRLKQALQLSEKVMHRAETSDDLYGLIELQLLRSFILRESGEHLAAKKHLIHALKLAEPENYLRIFADEGEVMVPLLQRVLHQLDRGETRENEKIIVFIRNILDVLSSDHQTEVSLKQEAFSPERQVKLTPREIELLRLIESGKTNREIAGELYISLGTVKGYLHQIFRKLHVKNRTEAVMKARQLQLY